MNRHIIYLLAIILIGNNACKSYSKHTIDDKPLVSVDSNLYGIWKAVEDTNKLDYILIQSPYDLFHRIVLLAAMDTGKYFPMALEFFSDTAEARQAAARYKHEFKAYLPDAYRSFEEKNGYYCYITRMDNNGTNPHYNQWTSFLSVVAGNTFINMEYRYNPIGKDGKFIGNSKLNEDGYFFVRIIKATPDTLLTAIVADPTMKYLTDSRAVRHRIEENINVATFYSDTLHFYKVTGYHQNLNESKKIANK